MSYKNINNAIIENRKKIIKNIKHASNGYKNFERFRNRILYSLRNDSTYLLTPIEEQLYVKRLRNKRSYDTYIKKSVTNHLNKLKWGDKTPHFNLFKIFCYPMLIKNADMFNC